MDNPKDDMGNLEVKTKSELIDLLTRQKKLLHNQKLLKSLPDKGQKIQLLVDRLQHLIDDRKLIIDNTAEMFEKMEIGGASSVPRVVENVFLRTDVRERKMFKPHRSLRMKSIPDDLERPPASLSRMDTPRRGLDERPAEESAAFTLPLKHPGTQPLSLAEAAELLEKQKSKVEALRAEQAIERLAERCHVKMGSYQPTAIGRYREDGNDNSSEEEDKEGEEEDEEDKLNHTDEVALE